MRQRSKGNIKKKEASEELKSLEYSSRKERAFYYLAMVWTMHRI
jgi:hypothetical protein